MYTFTAIAYFVAPVGTEFSRILLGSAVYNHDTVLNAAILEWGYRSLWTPGLHLFDWPAGFPLRNGLAGTENLVGWQTIYSPARAVGASVAASYNAVLMSSLVIAGTTAAALARRLGAAVPAALIGGFAFAFNPFHLDHLIHVQTMAICWSPLAILGLDMSLERPSFRGLSILAAGVLMTAWSGVYFAVFLAIVLPAYAVLCWLTGRHSFSRSSLGWIAATFLGCFIVLIPIALPYLDFARVYGRYPHGEGELALSALSFRSLLQTPAWLAAWARTPFAASGTGGFASAFPGLATLALAASGVLGYRSDRRSRSTVITLVVLAAICLLLAFGPTLQVQQGQPLGIANWFPLPGKLWLGISAIRWPMRIYMYSVLCLAILVSLGADKLLSATRSVWRSRLWLLILTLLFLELRPASWFARKSLAIGAPLSMSDAYSFLKQERDRGGVVELPSNKDSGLATPFATRYVYGSTGHLRGVIAFHGSMFPPVLESLRVASHSLPEPDAIRVMQSHGVSRLVIHSDLMSPDAARLLIGGLKSQGYPVVFNTRSSTVFSLIH